jgi:adenylate kinase
MLSESGRKLSSVVILVADDAELIDRISNRRVCPKCGASYNLKTKKPLKDGICDSCGSELIQRKDDCAESFKVRLEDYKAKTLPLVDYYKGKGLLKEVNALQDINVVFTDVKKILDEAKA